MSKTQSTLAFPSRKNAKPVKGKQQQQSASAKKSYTPAASTAVVNKQLVSTPRKAHDEDDDVQLTHARSSPRSEPIHRTTSSHERAKHGQSSNHIHTPTPTHSSHSTHSSHAHIPSTTSLHAPLLPSARDSLLPGTWTDASDNEILLRKFDLDITYGPCGGLSRKARWQRAQQLQLDPPQHVWDILQQIDDDGDDEEGREGGGGVEVDESERRKKRKKYDIDSHSIFENVGARILEAEGRGPP